MDKSTGIALLRIFGPNALSKINAVLSIVALSIFLIMLKAPSWLPLLLTSVTCWAFLSREGGYLESRARRKDHARVIDCLAKLLDVPPLAENVIQRLRILSLEIEVGGSDDHPLLAKSALSPWFVRRYKKRGYDLAPSFRCALSDMLEDALDKYRILIPTPYKVTSWKSVSFHSKLYSDVGKEHEFNERDLVTYLRNPPQIQF